jgi:hypothetical protein
MDLAGSVKKAIGLIEQAAAEGVKTRRVSRDMDPRLPLVDLAWTACLGAAIRAALPRELHAGRRTGNESALRGGQEGSHQCADLIFRDRRREPLHGAGPYRR